jgi:hypothetical protein
MPSFTVEYTDEAVRAMQKAERDVIAKTRNEIEDRYDAA